MYPDGSPVSDFTSKPSKSGVVDPTPPVPIFILPVPVPVDCKVKSPALFPHVDAAPAVKVIVLLGVKLIAPVPVTVKSSPPKVNAISSPLVVIVAPSS